LGNDIQKHLTSIILLVATMMLVLLMQLIPTSWMIIQMHSETGDTLNDEHRSSRIVVLEWRFITTKCVTPFRALTAI
jgi:hypothetical protein